MSQPNSQPNRISFYLLSFSVAGAPLWFGSVDPLSIAFWCAILGGAAILASPVVLRPGHIALLLMAMIVALAYGVVVSLQLTGPSSLVDADPVWADAAKALGTALAPSASIARNEPFFALGISFIALLSLVSAFLIAGDRDRARQLLMVIAWAGAAYAVFAIFSFLNDPTKVLWRDKQAYTNNLTGTFINRNTAAVYFGSSATVWLLLLCERIKRHYRDGWIPWRALPAKLFSHEPPILFPLAVIVLICIGATLMTGSRAGAVISAVILVLGFTIFFRRDLPRRTILAVVLAGAAIAFVLLNFVAAGISSRFEESGLTDASRVETYRSTLRIIASHPWLGVGLGTFVWAFPPYRSPDISLWGIWDRAHNTLLEIAAEMGIPLAALVAVGWVVMFVVLIHGIRTRRRDVVIPLAALCVGLIAVLHSLIDFSLQIPGYTITVFALLGAGIAQSFRTSHAAGRE